jgi:predicted nucleic acid-binding protein
MNSDNLKKYYVDTCIWLNLFKKEVGPATRYPYWRSAEEFIQNIIFSSDSEIIYSGFVLKEIREKLKDEISYFEKEKFFKEDKRFSFVKATPEDYFLGRKLESTFNFKISFFDCLHIAITKRVGAVLVTRDNLLIRYASSYVPAKRPEDLFS